MEQSPYTIPIGGFIMVPKKLWKQPSTYLAFDLELYRYSLDIIEKRLISELGRTVYYFSKHNFGREYMTGVLLRSGEGIYSLNNGLCMVDLSYQILNGKNKSNGKDLSQIILEIDREDFKARIPTNKLH